ncbi:thioester domain-containing protein [Saccharothrix xinjiangensis]|uniref:Thioester domain-containing protein n=1 Tax=Saccharothrix xinjiangensis TaxID=204798 RepID=A0ABV9XY96_9PSEU
MASRLTPKRLGAAVLGASIALSTAALPAFAEAVQIIPIERKIPGTEQDNPEFFKHHEEGIEIALEGEERDWFDANLIPLYVVEDGDKTVVKAYCVELPTTLKDGTPLHEVPWDEHPNPQTKFTENADRINWILHNSYPLRETSVLSGETGRDIDEREAIAATQAAIWHFSDGAALKSGTAATKDEDAGVDEDVRAVYEYLTGAENVGVEQQPAPTLEIEQPGSTTGKAGGDLIGPFVVKTTADSFVLEADLPQGVTFTDKDGNPLAPADGGFRAEATEPQATEIFVKVAEGTPVGEVKFSVKADAELQHGRLFVSVDSDKKTQSLVIAKPSKVQVEAQAGANWVAGTVVTQPSTPSQTSSTAPTTTTTAPTTTTTPVVSGGGDTDELASTGASIFVPLLIGLGLLGAGAAALLVVRRKRTA